MSPMALLRARRRTLSDDSGSIILSMLAVLVVSALLLVVGATIIAGQRQTTFDKTFEQALQIAEVGHNQMISLVQAKPDALQADVPVIEGTTTEGGTYRAEAVKDGRFWRITAEGGTTGGPRRTVEAKIAFRPLFSLAAFGRTLVDFNGGNGADSFDSAEGTTICWLGSSTNYADPGSPTAASTGSATDVNMCRESFGGAVATNEELNLKGGVAEKIDRAEIHNAREGVLDPLPDATGFCKGVTATCALFDGSSTARGKYYREPIELPAVTACDGFAGSPTPFTGNEYAFGGRAYNLSTVTLTGATRFTGTVAQPTILCVSGKLTIQQQHLINFEQKVYPDGATRWAPRRPGTLLIFMTAVGSASVEMGGNASLSAAVYAPNAAIICGPQGNVYGSLIANSIDNAGGWNFHYDTDLGNQMINAPVRLQDWREVLAGG